MIICAKCNRENEDHYKFCLGCGSSLAAQAAAEPAAAAMPTCTSCGADITPGQKFCGSCGARQDTTVAAAVPSEPAAAPAASASASAPAASASASAPAAAAPAEATPAAAAPAEAAATQAAAPAATQRSSHVDAPTEPAPQDNGVVGSLIMIRPDGSHGETVPLKAGENIFGRASGEPVFARDEFLSPQHVKFTVRGSEIEVTDLSSLNGVFMQIQDVVELTQGDFIRVGQELLRFEEINQVSAVIVGQGDVVAHGGERGGAWGRLGRVSGPRKTSVAFMLNKPEHVIGRERGDILFPDDGYVSGTHARVFRDGERVFLEDLRSSNGTFLKIRTSAVVASGAMVLMGKQPFRLHLGS